MAGAERLIPRGPIREARTLLDRLRAEFGDERAVDKISEDLESIRNCPNATGAAEQLQKMILCLRAAVDAPSDLRLEWLTNARRCSREAFRLVAAECARQNRLADARAHSPVLAPTDASCRSDRTGAETA